MTDNINKNKDEDKKKTEGMQELVMKVRSCEELKAIMKIRIRAEVKDERLAKKLENALADIVDYGAGGSIRDK